jgi:hypothetical protein
MKVILHDITREHADDAFHCVEWMLANPETTLCGFRIYGVFFSATRNINSITVRKHHDD